MVWGFRVMAEMKRCSRCGKEYPATPEYFHRDRTRKSGLNTACKTCINAYHRERYPECKAAKDKWRSENADHIREWRRANRDRLREYHRQYGRANRDRRNEYMRQYERANQDRIREYRRNRSKKRHVRDVHAANERLRRARLADADGKHTASDVYRLHAAQKGRCYYCGEKLGDDYHVDHYIPLAQGGTNGADNIVLACPACNLSKGAKMPGDWLQENGKLL